MIYIPKVIQYNYKRIYIGTSVLFFTSMLFCSYAHSNECTSSEVASKFTTFSNSDAAKDYIESCFQKKADGYKKIVETKGTSIDDLDTTDFGAVHKVFVSGSFTTPLDQNNKETPIEKEKSYIKDIRAFAGSVHTQCEANSTLKSGLASLCSDMSDLKKSKSYDPIFVKVSKAGKVDCTQGSTLMDPDCSTDKKINTASMGTDSDDNSGSGDTTDEHSDGGNAGPEQPDGPAITTNPDGSGGTPPDGSGDGDTNGDDQPTQDDINNLANMAGGLGNGMMPGMGGFGNSGGMMGSADSNLDLGDVDTSSDLRAATFETGEIKGGRADHGNIASFKPQDPNQFTEPFVDKTPRAIGKKAKGGNGAKPQGPGAPLGGSPVGGASGRSGGGKDKRRRGGGKYYKDILDNLGKGYFGAGAPAQQAGPQEIEEQRKKRTALAKAGGEKANQKEYLDYLNASFKAGLYRNNWSGNEPENFRTIRTHFDYARKQGMLNSRGRIVQPRAITSQRKK